jgi:MoaA/NifB/PqqE/SkfB family radical SAM enzyme
VKRQIANGRRLLRQFWARRREFGTPAFWLKAARIGTRVAQSALWPTPILKKTLRAFEDRPWNLHIETTNACNADCVFCAYQYMERDKRVMKMPVFEKALSDYCEMGGGDLMLEVVVGDPILDPLFLDKIRAARARPEIASIETITNGVGIDRLGAETFVKSGISRVFISTAGFERESYEKIYRIKKYDQMRGNVLDLLRENEKAGRPVEITIGFRTNRPLKTVMEDPDFQEVKRYRPHLDFTFAFDDWGGKIQFAELPKGFIKREPPAQTETCKWYYDGPIVFLNGDVGLCGCRDVEAKSELIVGNLMQRSLHEIWISPEVKSLRDRFLTPQKPAICRSCTMYRSLDDLRSTEGLRKARLTRQRFHASPCHSPPVGGGSPRPHPLPVVR